VDVLDVRVREKRSATTCIVSLLAFVVVACSGPVRMVRPQPCPPQSLFNERVPGELSLPRLEKIFVAPMPVPSRVHGNHAIIRVVIDTSGYVMRDSITVCGIKDPMYAQRLAEEVSQLRFHPGLMKARHVVAPTLMPANF
jgi:hypothetical protein